LFYSRNFQTKSKIFVKLWPLSGLENSPIFRVFREVDKGHPQKYNFGEIGKFTKPEKYSLFFHLSINSERFCIFDKRIKKFDQKKFEKKHKIINIFIEPKKHIFWIRLGLSEDLNATYMLITSKLNFIYGILDYF